MNRISLCIAAHYALPRLHADALSTGVQLTLIIDQALSLVGKVGRGIRLIRLNNLSSLDLLIGISRPDNLSLGRNNRESGESISGAELAAPARGDGVVAALDGAAVALRGLAALDDELAGGGSALVGVDLEVPGAGAVVLGTAALHALDGPLGSGGHHVDSLLGGGGGDAGG